VQHKRSLNSEGNRMPGKLLHSPKDVKNLFTPEQLRRAGNALICERDGLLTDYGSFGSVCAPLEMRRGFHVDT
jgi:hypothetical protein